MHASMNRRSFLRLSGAAAGAICAGWGAAGPSPAEAREEPPWAPAFPIADSHVHFWDPDHLRYAWLDGSETLNRPYLPADYRSAAGPVDVAHIIFVEAGGRPEDAEAEVEWVAGLAEDEPRIAAIVAYAPLHDAAAAGPVLERYKDNPKVRGVRRLIQGEPDADFALREGFVDGVKLAGACGLVCELGANHRQLAHLPALVEQCPDVRFVLNHIGSPDIRGGALDPWRDHISAIAESPNVYCKMSGVATVAHHDAWTAGDVRPYLEHVLEAFGPERVCFGSDWPVVLRAASWLRWLRTASEFLSAAAPESAEQVFRETALELYGVAS